MLVCEGETAGQMGEVDQVGERELVLVVLCQVQQGMRHDTWITSV